MVLQYERIVQDLAHERLLWNVKVNLVHQDVSSNRGNGGGKRKAKNSRRHRNVSSKMVDWIQLIFADIIASIFLNFYCSVHIGSFVGGLDQPCCVLVFVLSRCCRIITCTRSSLMVVKLLNRLIENSDNVDTLYSTKGQ